MKKSCFIAVLALSLNLSAADVQPVKDDSEFRLPFRFTESQLQKKERDAYKTWLDNYFSSAASAAPFFTEDEISHLESLLLVKPPFGSKYYDFWLKTYKSYLDSFLPFISKDENTMLDMLTRSKPEGRVSDDHYNQFLTYYMSKLNEFMPFISNDESTALNLITAIRPDRAGEGAYEAWLNQYNSLNSQFLPNISDDEKVILDFMMKIKPSAGNPYDDYNNGDSNPHNIQVSVRELRKALELIRNGNYGAAENLIQKLLKNY